MAQFKLENKVEVGKITLANFEQIKKDLTTSLEEYKTFKVTPETYVEAKSKKAALNNFEKTLNNAKKDIKKQYMLPYDNFELQMKELMGLVSEVSETINEGVKQLDEAAKNAKRLEIEMFVNEIKLILPLDKYYKQEWENKTYKIETIHDELLQLKAQVDDGLKYITNSVANDDLMLKARIKERFLETLNLISSIEEETQKHKEAASFIKELNENSQLESKDIEVILTVNEKQWYQVQTFLKTIGAKMTKKKEGN